MICVGGLRLVCVSGGLLRLDFVFPDCYFRVWVLLL